MGNSSVSYRNFHPSSTRASAFGRGNRSRNTTPELLLRRALWRAGVRYRLNGHGLVGRPDIVVTGSRTAVFCDGDLWHGRDWPRRKMKLERGANAAYWVRKIERNMQRDREVNQRLKAAGWRVIRVWEGDVNKDPTRIAREIRDAMDSR